MTNAKLHEDTLATSTEASADEIDMENVGPIRRKQSQRKSRPTSTRHESFMLSNAKITVHMHRDWATQIAASYKEKVNICLLCRR